MTTAETFEKLASSINLAQFELDECAKMASAYVSLISSEDALVGDQQEADMLYIDREDLTATYLLLHNYVLRAQAQLNESRRLLPTSE